jgi:hypothetical protein
MKEVNIIRNHELEANISGYPTYEAKDGPYHPLEEDEVWNG